MQALSAALAKRMKKVGIKANKRGIKAERCSFQLTVLDSLISGTEKEDFNQNTLREVRSSIIYS